MSTVEPGDIQYKITNKGIKIEGIITTWDSLGRFWFSKRFDSDLLVVETNKIPNKMEIVVMPELKLEIENHLKNYLVEEEVPSSTIDKAIDWFSKKMPQ